MSEELLSRAPCGGTLITATVTKLGVELYLFTSAAKLVTLKLTERGPIIIIARMDQNGR